LFDGAQQQTSPPHPETARLVPDGCTEAIMIAHGFTPEMMVDLIAAGLATASAERVVAGGKSIVRACTAKRV
jgi:hypothetical protein